jgi:subtilisin family serine protease/uncharacterized protein YozE (UPF0346 family)
VSTNLTFAATISPTWSLDREIDKSQRILENLGNSTDLVLEKVDARISDLEQSQRIEQKQEEIQELVDQAQEILEESTNKKEIQAIVQDTKNTIAIKVESAVTPTTDITDTIWKNISIAKKDIEQAKETLVGSLEVNNQIRIMIQTNLDEVSILQKLQKYDSSLGVEFQFDALTEEKVYELSLSKWSLLEQELFPNTETWEIPKSIFGMMIVQPELYSISEESPDMWSLLEKESLDKLWGIRAYGWFSLFGKIENFVQQSPKKVRVAIIDTWIESSHSDLRSRVNNTNGYDFVNDDADPTDDQGHGTHVAGTIAGSLDGQWVVGVNPWTELTALKICDSKGFCPSYAVIKALSYAKEQHFDVVNMSLGAKGNPQTSPICSGIQELSDAGTIVVAAAGNSNIDTSTFVPGGCASAVTVAAVDQNLKRASFSNFGTKVDVAAPGVGIYSSYLGGGYKSLNGTSMATPHIVGLASVARMYDSTLSTNAFKQLLKNAKTPVITEMNKPIANFVDVASFLDSLIGKGEGQKNEKKDDTPSEQKKQEPTTQTGSEDTGSTELKAVIDESIWLEIQKNEKIEINSVGEIKNDAVEINNADEKLQSISSATQETLPPQVFSSENVEVNSVNDPIDFSKIDFSHALTSTGDPKKLYGQEKTTIELSEKDIPEGYTAINSDTDEEYPVQIGEQSEPLLEESENTTIQNTYTCSVYVGYTCSYNLPAAGIRQYNMGNTNIASVSAGNTSFTVTGKSVGSTTLYVNYAGRTIATVYITVQKMLVPIGANYGTNTLEVGQNTYLFIRNGNGGYAVSSSNPLVVYVSGYDTNWTLSAMNPGTATITYRDSAGYYGTINMIVTAPPRNLSVSVWQTSLEKWKTTPLTITDGNGGYSVSSSNTAVVSVSGNNTNWTLTALWAGTATITVSDARGKVTSVAITVTQPTPLRPLYLYYNSNPHHIGWVSSITITDGNGGYTVTSSDPNILTVSGSHTNWTLTAKSPWSVTVTVQDQKWMTLRLPYTVLRQVSWTLSNTSPYLGWTPPTFTVRDWNWGYTLTSSNTSVATVRQTTTGVDTHYTIIPVATGETTLTIRDRYGSWWWIKMTVRPQARSLTVDKTTLTVEVGSDAYFQVTSGNWGYGHSMSNSNVWWYYADYSIPSYRVRGVNVGSTILQIRDSAGQIVQVRVEVKAKEVTPTATLSNLEFSPSIRDESMWGIYFEVEWTYKEAWIEYHYGDKLQPITEKLVLQDDHAYATLYSLDCTDKTTCKVYLKPYVIDTNGKKIYHKNYDGTNYTAVGYDLTGTNIANAGEEWVEVNGLKETVASLKQIGINIQRTAIEYKWVYDGGYDAVNDQLKELKAFLDAETYKQFGREIKKLATKLVNGDYNTQAYIQKLKQDFSELSTILESAYSYLGQLTSYDKQYYGSYLSVSSAITFIWPGKLKWTQALAKVEKKAVDAIQKWRAVVLAKGIKSIDGHIFTKHKFGADSDGSKFLEGADIEKVIKEGYWKSGKKIVETTSTDLTTWKTFSTIKIEVDMERKIGTSKQYALEYNKMRIIVDYEWNVVSAYPIGDFSIN